MAPLDNQTVRSMGVARQVDDVNRRPQGVEAVVPCLHFVNARY